MTFRLFGFDVEIQFGFWLTAGILGLGFLRSETPSSIFVWVAVILVSILVHELGHAFAIRRHRIQPVIALHWMGGTTSWRMAQPLTRSDRIVISLAGPFAGFGLALLVWIVGQLIPGGVESLPLYGLIAYDQLLWINTLWGLINLLPVLPLDGGHVLEEAMGPTRVRATMIISASAGALAAVFFISNGWFLPAMFFGFGAMQSYQRLRAEGSDAPRPAARQPHPEEDEEEPIPPATLSVLKRARAALANEDFEQVIELAEQVLSGTKAGEDDSEEPERPPPAAARVALELIAWAHLLRDQLDEAVAAHGAVAQLGQPDLALTAAIHIAKGNTREARRVLEMARASGDDRKEVVGPLIQLLIGSGEIPRASAVALDIIDALSSDDARRVASIAFDGRAYEWSARLSEAMFERDHAPEDAYEAARAHAQDGARERALELLRHAVEAGFTDRARAWSDAALEALRLGGPEFEAMLPRP